jgi:hypothetical protein
MSTKAILLAVAAVALAAGVLLMLSGLATVVESMGVTVFNYDPPGPPYTLIVLKAGPGRDYERMGFLGPGITAEAIARDAGGGWLLLRQPEAWVSTTAGEVTGEIDMLPVTDLTLAALPIPPVTVHNPEDGSPVDKRLGPAEAFDVIGTLDPGTSTTAIARDPGGLWLLTELAGWVLATDLEVSGDVNSLPAIHITP